MISTVNRLLPAEGSELNSAEMRAQFNATANDIEALQATMGSGGPTGPTGPAGPTGATGPTGPTGATGSSSVANISNVTLDFGSLPGSNEASATVTGQTAITTAHRPTAAIQAVASGSHTANDASYAALFIALTCATPIAGTGYTINARSTEKLTGTYIAAGQWS